MPSTDPTPTTALKMLDQATALVRARTARFGAEPAPAPTVTVVLDDAAALLADPSSPAGVRVRARSYRQYATPAEFTAAIERGEV